MERPIDGDLENTQRVEGRVQKKVWSTPVLIIADVSTSGGKTVDVVEVSGLIGPGS